MITTFDEYQEATAKTAIYPKDRAMEYLLCGLASEVGELLGKWKKIIRDNDGVLKPEKRMELLKELGDCYWYSSELATILQATMQEVANINIDKLTKRKENNTLQGSGDNR